MPSCGQSAGGGIDPLADAGGDCRAAEFAGQQSRVRGGLLRGELPLRVGVSPSSVRKRGSERQVFFHRHLAFGLLFDLHFFQQAAAFPIAAGKPHAGDDGGDDDRNCHRPPNAVGAERRVFGKHIGQGKSQNPKRDDRQHHGRHGIARAAQRAGENLLQADEAEGEAQDADERGAFGDGFARLEALRTPKPAERRRIAQCRRS